MHNDQEQDKDQGECVTPIQIPAGELERYRVDADPHSERDIATYVEGQARDESVQHVEKIKREIILGSEYEMWDVVTDKGRWWVITNLTNLYSQSHFPSLDYTLSFHIGLMTRLRSRSDRIDAEAPNPFDEVLRRMDQAELKHDAAVEAEDYQAVGVQLREGLISLVDAMRRRTDLRTDDPLPQASNFIGWSELLLNSLCPGGSNKELRQHLKNTSKETWQIVNWLTHHRNAGKTASSIAIHSSQTTVGHFIQILERSRIDKTESCPVCKSREIRSHFDIMIPPDGDYYASCGTCQWTNHPGSREP